MEDTFVVHGGRPLFGEIFVDGSKNAALPLLFSTLITPGTFTFARVPRIGDVAAALAILSRYGVRHRWESDGRLFIDAASVHDAEVEPTLLGCLRGSTYLIGASLSRFGHAPLAAFGGCHFGDRPIDMHLHAVLAFGGCVREGEAVCETLHAGHVRFHTPSVGATINALLLASSVSGESILENPASEPHVGMLIDHLRACGASIERRDDRLIVRGGALRGRDAEVIPDMIEAGTYLLLGAITNGSVTVSDFDPEHLQSFFSAMQEAGLFLTRGATYARLSRTATPKPFAIRTAPYPAYPTDLHPQCAVLMAQLSGGTITEGVFPSRFAYLRSLDAFGIRSQTSGATARIFPSAPHPADVRATDLRGGAAALLAALVAHGESRIRDAHVILRGYADVVQKLRGVGARIDLV